MALGKRDGHAATPWSRVQTQRLYCTEAVTALNFLTVDYTDTTYGEGNSFEQADAAQEQVVAVAAETTTAAGWALCYVKGDVDGCNVDASTTAGAPLEGSSTAGRAAPGDTSSNATLPYGAIALEADVSNVAKVRLLDPLGLAG